jgi:hypothetical protein
VTKAFMDSPERLLKHLNIVADTKQRGKRSAGIGESMDESD